MKFIKIQRLTLENFKSHATLTIAPKGSSISVYGDNATGKSSIADAFSWLLFGKDSRGNGEKNIDLKPLNSDGEVKDHAAITAVEAELLVGEDKIVLRRELREIWSQKRGSVETTYDGNESRYYVDGVPVKKNEYDRTVGEIISEELGRILCSVDYFATMKWQDRRRILSEMAGVPDDKDLMQGAENGLFAPLAEAMGSSDLDHLRAKLAAEKRNLTGIRNDKPGRLDEVTAQLRQLEAIDFQNARQQADRLREEQEALERKAEENKQKASENLSKALAEYQRSREKILGDMAELRAENERYRRELETASGNGRARREALERKAYIETEISRAEVDLKLLERRIQISAGVVEDDRKAWHSINNETFHGDTCVTCGQKLPEAMILKARANFEADKAKRMAKVVSAAESHKEALKADEERKAHLLERLEERRKEAAALVIPEDTAKPVEDLKNFREDLSAMEAKLDKLTAPVMEPVETYADRRGEITTALYGLSATMAQQPILDKLTRRAEELRQELKDATLRLERVEKLLYLMEEYTRYKAKAIENLVNSLFRLARFRLFRPQANGGMEERCDVVYDGVPYLSLNSSMKINIGIDMIRSLSKHFGVSMPLFVDNAESVTAAEKTGGQMIMLVVSAMDKNLRIVEEVNHED